MLCVLFLLSISIIILPAAPAKDSGLKAPSSEKILYAFYSRIVRTSMLVRS